MARSGGRWRDLPERYGEKGGADAQGLGRSRGGLGTKIHAVVDALGLPVRFMLSPGHRGDVIYGKDLLEGLKPRHVIADRAYDAEHSTILFLTLEPFPSFRQDQNGDARTLAFTPVCSPQGNGIPEAFVKTLKRDYARNVILPDAETVLALLPKWFDDYTEIHPHSGLRFLSPREFRAKAAGA